jgi:hypothetical protein
MGRPSTLVLNGHGVAVNADHSKSWMDPAAKAGTLLYISDAGTNDVLVYSYPKLALVGTLTGFNQPQGECVDKSGNVWIANTSSSQLLEYAHGGTTAIATLNDANQYPAGCAVNMKNGDLAATNIFGTAGPSSVPGSISVYKGASGNPKVTSPAGFFEVYFGGYASNGTLYFDGRDSSGAFLMGSLKGKKVTNISLSPSVGFPGAVEGNGSNVVVGDQTFDANFVDVYTISGSSGTQVSSNPLTGAADVVQFTVNKKTLAGGNYNPSGTTSVELFKFPGGGSPTKSVTGAVEPIGAAISK